MEETLILIALPVFIITILVEWRMTREDSSKGKYVLPDTAANLAMGIGYLIGQVLFKAVPIAIYVWLYQHRILSFEMGVLAYIALFFLDDLCYYIFHRAHHEVRILWAVHVNHHSSQEYNLSTALRQPWLEPFVGPFFWMPLPLLGFSVEAVVVQQLINLLYQYWVHTKQVKRMPDWFEWIFNTPSHHRAHHGSNPEYLDKNYGGILIIWDRMFGTFEPERAPVKYGLVKDVESYNPVWIAFHELVQITVDVRNATTVRQKLKRVFGAP